MSFKNIWVAAVMVLAMAACGGGSPCDRKSPCMNDVMNTPAEVEQCKQTLNANMNSPCYSEYLALATCFQDSTVCGSDGKTDGALTLTKASNNCTQQGANRSACCAKSPTASACQ
jgi:hypothetical protein